MPLFVPRPAALAPSRRGLWALLFAAALLINHADAQADTTAPAASALTPPAPPGDGATATRILKDVEASASTPRLSQVVASPVQKAKSALERAHGARMSGDTAHARMFDGLALEWAETARDLLRAVAAEDAAVAAGQKAREVELKVERARALLEETQARHGRAIADIERLEAEAAEAAKKASAAEAERIDAASKKPGAKQGERKPKPKAAASDKKPSGGGAPAPRRSP